MMFGELPFAARFAAAAAAGFDGVEIQRIDEATPHAIAAAATQAGVQVALINVPMGDLLSGGPGLSGVPGREQAYVRALHQAFETATLIGAHRVHLGPSRVPPGLSRDDCLPTYLANIATAAELSAAAGIPAVVEGMNRVDAPDALIASVDLAAEMVHRVPGIGLLFDAYHVAKGGHDPAAAFARHRAIARHVQIADAPARTAPGTGTIAWDRFFAALADAGYAGWIGAEYPCAGDTPATLGWLKPARRSARAAPPRS